jgi:hypothetical protein
MGASPIFCQRASRQLCLSPPKTFLGFDGRNYIRSVCGRQQLF